MQLNAFARNQLGLGHAALLINEGLVLHVVEDLKRRYPLANMTVGLLGMASQMRRAHAYRQANFLGKPVFDLWGHVEYDNAIR